MKPINNRIFCIGCKRPKMLFDSEKKAENFIKYNSAAIAEESRKAPVRAYYCSFCVGWHVTSISDIRASEILEERDKEMWMRIGLRNQAIDMAEGKRPIRRRYDDLDYDDSDEDDENLESKPTKCVDDDPDKMRRRIKRRSNPDDPEGSSLNQADCSAKIMKKLRKKLLKVPHGQHLDSVYIAFDKAATLCSMSIYRIDLPTMRTAYEEMSRHLRKAQEIASEYNLQNVLLTRRCVTMLNTEEMIGLIEKMMSNPEEARRVIDDFELQKEMEAACRVSHISGDPKRQRRLVETAGRYSGGPARAMGSSTPLTAIWILPSWGRIPWQKTVSAGQSSAWCAGSAPLFPRRTWARQ